MSRVNSSRRYDYFARRGRVPRPRACGTGGSGSRYSSCSVRSTRFVTQTTRVVTCGAGVTLVEMLAAIALSSFIVLGIVAFTRLAEDSFAAERKSMEAIHIARSCFQQIENAVDQAWANERFPGAIVVPLSISGTYLPETLVVWCPSTGQPRDPNGLPYLDELIVFAVNDSRPNELRKYRSLNSTPAPNPSDLGAWQTVVNALKNQSPAESQVLTDRLRTFVINSRVCGAVRFRIDLAPSNSEWNNTSISWNSLSWPQGLFSPSRGTRRVSLHTEIQLQKLTSSDSSQQQGSYVFWYSRAFAYSMRKELRPQ